MSKSSIKVGGACGFWGDWTGSTSQLLEEPDLDFLVYDYLAEITLAIMARARAKDPSKGYASDFIRDVMAPNLKTLAAKGVKALSSAGGMNPIACKEALEADIAKQGLSLEVAAVSGDDFLGSAKDAPLVPFRQEDLEKVPFDRLLSANAYLGAAPVVAALKAGADIVVTGRIADSALTLAAAIYSFDWTYDDWDLLSAGSLAGHILECGPQATGGNFTDWHLIAEDIANIGYPVGTIKADGTLTVTKPAGTGGLVSRETVAEQLLYEIGDPAAYMLPDVVCDFTDVKVENSGENCVVVTGAKGRARPETLKTSLIYQDGFRGGTLVSFYGDRAAEKAQVFAEAVIARTEQKLTALGAPGYTHTSIEILGAGSQFGPADPGATEVTLKIAALHPSDLAIGLLIRELSGLGLTTPPGLSGFAGSRPAPQPRVLLTSALIARDAVKPVVTVTGEQPEIIDDIAVENGPSDALATTGTIETPITQTPGDSIQVPLMKLAVARSGDKGDDSNIGVVPRHPDFIAPVFQGLTAERVGQSLQHFRKNDSVVHRFELPGLPALNFLITRVLDGGGTASLRNDPQGKGYGQVLLAQKIAVPREIAEAHGLMEGHNDPV